MMDVAALVDEMRQGRLPEDWQPTATMNVGDEIAALVDRNSDLSELEQDVENAANVIDPGGERRSAASDISVILARFNANKVTADGLRETLVAFGALDADDDETDMLALLRILLPSTG